MEQRNKVGDFYKYLKTKVKLKITLSKIWFNKQCLLNNIIPKYAKIEIKGSSDIQKKVKKLSEQLWVKQEIKYLYQQQMCIRDRPYSDQQSRITIFYEYFLH